MKVLVRSNIVHLSEFRSAQEKAWAVAKGRCRACGGGAEGIHVVHVESDLDRGECPDCGQMAWAVEAFIHDDGVWRNREPALAREEGTER